MHVFIVYCHPSENSFTNNVKNEFIKGLESQGHTYEISDLYKMNFNGDLSEDEYLREANLHDAEKEYSYTEDFPGDGFYFFEEGEKPYCTYYIYGSGLPIIYEYTSTVNINDEGDIEISLALIYNEANSSTEETKVLLKYENNSIQYNNKTYSVKEKSN